jgi:hypothetical protein
MSKKIRRAAVRPRKAVELRAMLRFRRAVVKTPCGVLAFSKGTGCVM